jgi:hypothetical protein
MSKPARDPQPVVDRLQPPPLRGAGLRGRAKKRFRSIEERVEHLVREMRREMSKDLARGFERRLEVFLDDVKRIAAAHDPDSLDSLKQIERTAQIANVAEIAASLQGHLGQRVTAYLSGVKDPKMVGRWARGSVKPREVAELRLRAAYPAAELLVDVYGPDTARAWFFGTNARLGGEAPAYLLRHGEPPFQELLPAARAFVQGDVS